jgi:hypothetical protein
VAPDRLWRRLAVIGGLGALAFVAPLLDLYGKNPEVFVANRTNVVEIVAFGLGVALLIPLVAWAVLAIAGAIGGRAPLIAFWTLVGVLAITSGMVVSRQVLPESTFGAVVLTLAIAAVLVWLVGNIEVVFVVGAVAVPVVLVMFLATSATARLIWDDPETAETPVTVSDPSHVVMIQLDEMPLASIMETDGTINETLFPGFARLADQGTWYRNALSDSIATTQSVPAILTGARGEPGESPSVVDHPNNLFTLLGKSYEMHVIEWVAELCPEETCPEYAGRAPARFSNLLRDVGVVYGHLTLPAAMRENLPSIDNSWRGFLGQQESSAGAAVEIEGVPVPNGEMREDWVNWVQRLINGIDSGRPPTLSYAHLRAPHVPWSTNPSGTHYERPEEYTEVYGVQGDGHWGHEPDPSLLGFQRHLYQVGFLDKMLSRLFDHIDESGTWDDTMIIVVADHGASFVPGEHRRWPYDDNRDDLYRVPLFIKYPGQTSGETVDLPAFGIDILPTIVDALGVETDWEFDGQSLLAIEEERPHEPIRWCCNGEGASTDLDILYQQVERNHQWVPDQSSWVGVSAVGANADLVGEVTTELDIDTGAGFRWSLDLGSTLAQVDRSEGIIQTLVTGRVEVDAQPASDDVLIVLNDVVAGVGHLTQDGPTSGTIIGLVAEDLVEDGANDIEILLAGGEGLWVAGESDELSLELATENGRVLELGVEGARRVQVDSVEPVEGGWTVTGWAADVTAKQTPDTIYVFAGDELLASSPPNVDNANVVRWFESEDLLRSGFEIELAEDRVPEGADSLLVVAEFGDVAVADPVTLTP